MKLLVDTTKEAPRFCVGKKVEQQKATQKVLAHNEKKVDNKWLLILILSCKAIKLSKLTVDIGLYGDM